MILSYLLERIYISHANLPILLMSGESIIYQSMIFLFIYWKPALNLPEWNIP